MLVGQQCGVKMKYSICGLAIEIKQGENIGEWEKFILEKQDNEIFRIFFANSKETIHGIEYINLPFQVHKLSQFGSGIMAIEKNWEQVALISTYNEWERETLIIQCFYTHAVQRHMIQFHSSLIDYQGRGLMFLGPSGIGKTTQAELWNQYRNALIINGDIVFVQETEESFLGWGTRGMDRLRTARIRMFLWRL